MCHLGFVAGVPGWAKRLEGQGRPGGLRWDKTSASAHLATARPCRQSWAGFKPPVQAADLSVLKPIRTTLCFFFDLADSIQVDYLWQEGKGVVQNMVGCQLPPAFPCLAVMEQQGGVGNPVQNENAIGRMHKNEGVCFCFYSRCQLKRVFFFNPLL